MNPSTVSVSAPGRVNLVGEHTDYSLLPVLPIAIQRRITVSAEPSGSAVVEARSTAFPGVYRSDRRDNPAWSAYVDSAVGLVSPVRGAKLRIGGDLPASGGLSSSSALTVAVLLALLRLTGDEPERDRLVALAVEAERATGVEGGTMDQTVIVYADAGAALRIGFAPTVLEPVPIPAHVAFVAGYSGSPAPKGGVARSAYNARVVGTRTAAMLLGAYPPVLGRVSGDTEHIVASLPEFAIPPAEATALRAGSYTDPSPLPVRAWARHVLTEAGRVDGAVEAVRAGDVAEIGRIFDASHASLADDFGASSPGLDELVATARGAGASGARLTGAGFGGWAVAVCDRNRADAVTGAMAAHAGEAFLIDPSAGVS
jgi:galactokinase